MADILNTEENYNPKLGLKNIYTKLLEIIVKVNTLWSNLVAQPKVYKALLTQTGILAPVAKVLVNTLSNTLVWTRSSAGNYSGTLTGEFVHNKTYVFGIIDYYDQGQTLIPISDGSSIIGYYSIFITDPNSIDVEVFDATFTNVDLSTLLGTSSICLPPIEVYS